MELNEKLRGLAAEYSFATTVKESAKVRIQCSLAEWELVQAEAKRLYRDRQAQKVKDPSRYYRA